MISKKVLLSVLLSTCWVFCSSSRRQPIEKNPTPFQKDKSVDAPSESLKNIRKHLHRLLSALVHLREKVEKKCPSKLKKVEKGIERVELLLKKVKSNQALLNIKESDLDQIRLEIQDLIIEVRQEISGQSEKKNNEMDVSSHMENSELEKKENYHEEVITKEDLQKIDTRISLLKDKWNTFLIKVEEMKRFISKCGPQDPSSCMMTIHEKICRDINNIYLKSHESIYHVILIEDEIKFFLSQEELDLSKANFSRLQSDLYIEEEEFLNIQAVFEQFLSAKEKIPHYFFSGEEKPKKIDGTSSSDFPPTIQENKEIKKLIYFSEKNLQEQINLCRMALKEFTEQFQKFHDRFQILQEIDNFDPTIVQVNKELSDLEKELKDFRSCLTEKLEEFFDKGNLSPEEQTKIFQKKKIVSQKLAQLNQIFDFLEEKTSLAKEKTGQIRGIHLIEKGETIFSIAEQYDTTIKNILDVNPSQKRPFLEGDLIKIPVKKEVSIKEET